MTQKEASAQSKCEIIKTKNPMTQKEASEIQYKSKQNQLDMIKLAQSQFYLE